MSEWLVVIVLHCTQMQAFIGKTYHACMQKNIACAKEKSGIPFIAPLHKDMLECLEKDLK